MRVKMSWCQPTILLFVALLSISCSASRSISENATVAGSGQPSLKSFSASAVAASAAIVALMQELPESEIEYSLSEHGGLYTARSDEEWNGVSSDRPQIQVSRSWDVAPDGLDVLSGNELRITATALVESGSGAFIELSLMFPQTSVLTDYGDLRLDQVAHALESEPFTVTLAQVDPTYYPASFTSRRMTRAAFSTYESGAGYSTYAENGQDLVQASDAQLADIARMLEESAQSIRRTWLDPRSSSAGISSSTGSISADTGPTAVTGETMQKLGVCQQQCKISGRANFTHSTWGQSTLYTTLHTGGGPGEAHIVVLNANRQVVWKYDSDQFTELAVAMPPVDDTGHIFVNFDPGRLNGVIVLSSADDGFDTYSSLPASGEYRTRFYGARIVDIDGDRVNEIEVETNDCNPSCAGGTATTRLFKWDGRDYVAE